MDYTEILAALNKASLFDLHRLRSSIDQELSNPERLNAIKDRLEPEQQISYFDPDMNCLIDAVIVKIKSTRCSVKNIKDGRSWNLPFYFINIDNVDTDIRLLKNQKGIPKSVLKVGDKIGFKGKAQNDLYGEVIRLNKQTATVLVDQQHQWRVSYSLLFSVLDGEHSEQKNVQEFLPKTE